MKLAKIIGAVWIGTVLLNLAIFVAVVWVVIHFVSKWW